ncbi:G2/mitotic-specific cyclin-B3 [Gastrophryne carolinensis]
MYVTNSFTSTGARHLNHNLKTLRAGRAGVFVGRDGTSPGFSFFVRPSKMLPASHSSRSLLPKPRPGKVVSEENVSLGKMTSAQVKRPPASPKGGAKEKRSAFGDITNAHKNQPQVPKKKEGQNASKKKSTATLSKNEINVQRAPRKLGNTALALEVKKPKATEVEAQSAPAVDLPVVAVPEEAVLPPDVEDIDKDAKDDPLAGSEYAVDIFNYMREREEKFVLPDYMDLQRNLGKEMRSILVDWMVEVQENFELNHETLYLAVKLVDHYLAASVTSREKLQLIGSTAVFIASKFEERCPPCLDDFLYICDDAYKREELLAMEVDVLRKLNFDLNIPVPYRFLRRFAMCAHASMETLTLSRYICELTLQEYDFVQERASKMAAASLFLALKMKNLGGWTATLQHYTGYIDTELLPLVQRLNILVARPPNDKLKAVRSKYSHRVFFEVAKLPALEMPKLTDVSEN